MEHAYHKVKVTYHGKHPTLVRPFVNAGKIEVQPGDTVEVQLNIANVLVGNSPVLWSIEGAPEKFDRAEVERVAAVEKETAESNAKIEQQRKDEIAASQNTPPAPEKKGGLFGGGK